MTLPARDPSRPLARTGEPGDPLGRVARAIVLVAFVALAGCADPDAMTRGEPSFGPAILVDADVSGSEPRLAIAEDGRLYLSAMPGNTQDSLFGIPYASRLYASDDGLSWTRLPPAPTGPRDATAGGGDSDVAVGPDGRVLVIDAWGGADAAAFSVDLGATWTYSPVSSEVPFHDRPWSAMDARGRGYVVARTFVPAAAEWVGRSDDDGRTWRNVGRAWTMDARTGTGVTNGNVVVDAADALHTPYTCGSGLCVASSRDGGVTWTSEMAVARAEPLSIFPVLAADGERLVLAWAQEDGEAITVWRATRDATWSAPERASPERGLHVLPWVAARDGRIVVAWYGTDAQGDPNDVAAMADARWDVIVATCAPTCVTRVAAPDVHRGSVNTRGVAMSPTDAPDWTLGDFLSVSIDARGLAHVAFTTGARDAPRAGYVREGR